MHMHNKQTDHEIRGVTGSSCTTLA